MAADPTSTDRGKPAEGSPMRTITHKTGYLYQAGAYEGDAVWYKGCESWHRTYKGAQRAKARNGDRGSVYRLTGEDTSYKVQS